MIPLNSIREALPSIITAYAHHGRSIEARHEVARREIRLYDHDYGIELNPINEGRFLTASRAEAIHLIREACREPTSLEILYYAQVGGPHVRGES